MALLDTIGDGYVGKQARGIGIVELRELGKFVPLRHANAVLDLREVVLDDVGLTRDFLLHFDDETGESISHAALQASGRKKRVLHVLFRPRVDALSGWKIVRVPEGLQVRVHEHQ